MNDRPTSEVLNLTADLIEERGWVRGKGWHPTPEYTGPLCIEGALTALLGYRDKWACPIYVAVSEYLRGADVTIGGNGMPIVWTWNDRPGRSQAEVIEVLRAVALIESARERETAEVTA